MNDWNYGFYTGICAGATVTMLILIVVLKCWPKSSDQCPNIRTSVGVPTLIIKEYYQ